MANIMVAVYTDAGIGSSGRRMALPLTTKFRTPSTKAKQIAITFRRKINRLRDSAVENTNSTTSSGIRHAHKDVTTVTKVNGARMFRTKSVMITSCAVELVG